MNENKCNLCPRNCNADRNNGEKGFCLAAGSDVLVSRAALHFWEEPCISGEEGSGTVFFSGCNLHCIYCQNGVISSLKVGKTVDVEKLSDIFLSLQDQGANNINLVTPTHYTEQIIRAVILARRKGLSVPIVYNCSGYEKADTLARLEGIVDIYLTDFKYMEREIADAFSHAPDYPEVARAAVKEMVRQIPSCEFDERGMMKRGVIVRHLLLPGHVKNAKSVIYYIYENYQDGVYLSLMNQYTPMKQYDAYPELNRKVTAREYERLIDYALSLGIKNAFIQEGETAKESFIPAFDYEGLEKY